MRFRDSTELAAGDAGPAVDTGWLRGVVDAARFYLGFASFAAHCLLKSAVVSAGVIALPPGMRRPFARKAISNLFRTHLQAMSWMGVMRLDLSALDSLRDAPAVIIAPNHPSLLDAALVLSRVSDVTCIMKAAVLRSVLFGSGARAAGYITSEPTRTMLRAAIDDLQAGNHLLLFPEGTRTVQLPVNALQRTAGLIARRAGARVQTVIIESDTAFLGKGWPLLRVPSLPIRYKVRLGRCFDAPADVDAFVRQLEDYFRAEIARSQVAVLSSARPAPDR